MFKQEKFHVNFFWNFPWYMKICRFHKVNILVLYYDSNEWQKYILALFLQARLIWHYDLLALDTSYTFVITKTVSIS